MHRRLGDHDNLPADDPDRVRATMHMCIVQAALALQDHTLAAEHARAFMEHWTTPAEVEAVVREQPTDTLREVWRALLAKSEAEGLDANHQWQTVLRLLLGQPDEALEQLQRTYDARQGWRLPFLAVDPLRDEDGFRALLAQIEASRSPLRPPRRSSAMGASRYTTDTDRRRDERASPRWCAAMPVVDHDLRLVCCARRHVRAHPGGASPSCALGLAAPRPELQCFRSEVRVKWR